MGKSQKIHLEDINYWSVAADMIRNFWVILLAAASAWMLVNLACTLSYEPEYTSTATLAVSSASSSAGALSNLSTTTGMAEMFSSVFESDILNTQVAEAMGVSSLDAEISASVISETNLLRVTVVAGSPQAAYRTLKATLENYGNLAETMFSNVYLTEIKAPNVPMSPSNSSSASEMARNGAFAGAILAALVLAILSATRETIQTRSAARHQLEGSLFGSISHDAKNIAPADAKLAAVQQPAKSRAQSDSGSEPRSKKGNASKTGAQSGKNRAAKGAPVDGQAAKASSLQSEKESAGQDSVLSAKSQAAKTGKWSRILPRRKKIKTAALITNPLVSYHFQEDCERLCSRFDYYMQEHAKKILLISSAEENEGKSTIAANLALALASRGRSVLLVDADLRKPSQHKIFEVGKNEAQDYAAYLVNQEKTIPKEIFVDKKGVSLLVNHRPYVQTRHAISEQRMREFLNQLRERFDYIILDSPPMLVATDAESLTRLSEEVLLVVRQDWSITRDINDCIDSLQKGEAHFLGYVLNNMQSRRNRSIVSWRNHAGM